MPTLRISCEYLCPLNWSLLKAGVPLFSQFVVQMEDAPPQPLYIEVALGDFLRQNRTEIKPNELGSNLAGKLLSYLTPQWRWGFADWRASQPQPAFLTLTIGRTVLHIPIQWLPANHWHRVIGPGGRWLSTRALESWPCDPASPGVQYPETIRRRLSWEGNSPPLEAAIAALINRNDCFSRPSGWLGRLVTERLLTHLKERTVSPGNPSSMDLLRAFYEAMLSKPALPADFQREFVRGVQAVRLLREEREQGALCLDLACLGSEVLESRGHGPVMLLTHGGRHAVTGAWRGEAEELTGGQPVCSDPAEVAERIDSGSLHLLDASWALAGLPYEEALRRSTWTALQEGFVHAVDIRACRRWRVGSQIFRIWPLERPGALTWVENYLTRLMKEISPTFREKVYLSTPEYQDFLNRFPIEPQLQESQAVTEHGGEAAIDLLRLSGHREKIPEAFDFLRQRTTRGLFLHDPVDFYVPLRARLRDSGETVPLFAEREALLDSLAVPGQRLALFAHGGSGKTYLCERLAHLLAEGHLRHPVPGSPIPIFLRLRQLGAEEEDVLRVLAREVGCEMSDLEDAERNWRLVFILDSLEESTYSQLHARPEDYVNLLRSVTELKNSSILLTSRPSLFAALDLKATLPGFRLTDLENWTETEIGLFFRRCEEEKGISFRDGWRAFHGLICNEPKLFELARTPLFSRMIVVTRDSISGVKSPADLYERYSHHCFERRQHRVPVELAREATEEVAGLMYRKQESNLPRTEILHALCAHQPQLSQLEWEGFAKRDILVHGLLVPRAEEVNGERGEKFRFSHLSFQDYFLAACLVRELTADLPLSLGRAALSEGTIDFAAEMLKRPPRAVPPGWIAEKLRIKRSLRRRLLRRQPMGMLWPERAEDVAFRNLVLICLRAGCSLAGYDLSELQGEARLAGIDLRRVRLPGTDLRLSDLRGALLVGADLAGCNLSGADLTGADLDGANLARADLRRCELSYIKGSPRLHQAKSLDLIQVDAKDATTRQLLLAWQSGAPPGD